MKYYDWSAEKNERLKQERGLGFEDVVEAITAEKVLTIISHPQKRFAHQKILIVEINGYAFIVPYVQEGEKVFFKTIIPSRKATKTYIILKRKKS